MYAFYRLTTAMEGTDWEKCCFFAESMLKIGEIMTKWVDEEIDRLHKTRFYGFDSECEVEDLILSQCPEISKEYLHSITHTRNGISLFKKHTWADISREKVTSPHSDVSVCFYTFQYEYKCDDDDEDDEGDDNDGLSKSTVTIRVVDDKKRKLYTFENDKANDNYGDAEEGTFACFSPYKEHADVISLDNVCSDGSFCLSSVFNIRNKATFNGTDEDEYNYLVQNMFRTAKGERIVPAVSLLLFWSSASKKKGGDGYYGMEGTIKEDELAEDDHFFFCARDYVYSNFGTDIYFYSGKFVHAFPGTLLEKLFPSSVAPEVKKNKKMHRHQPPKIEMDVSLLSIPSLKVSAKPANFDILSSSGLLV